MRPKTTTVTVQALATKIAVSHGKECLKRKAT